MANWYGTSRSNYFRVKDDCDFRVWADTVGLRLLEYDGDGLFAIAPPEANDGYWPSSMDVYDEEGDVEDEVSIDIVDELPKFLAEGQVAILMRAGAEKLRYVSGHATAVTWDGRVTYVNLNDIYQKAADEFGVAVGTITLAEY